MRRKDITNEILKYISPNELGERMEDKKTEMGGLFSPEACEFIIAKELGIKIEDTQIPKTMDYIIRNLADDIDQYCGEILDRYFTKHTYKRTVKDWDYSLLNSEDFKDKILKESWVCTNEWDKSTGCYKEECNKLPKDLDWEDWLTEEERNKECKDCFKIAKEKMIRDYKRSIDIGINYFKRYINELKKDNSLRKEYHSTKQTHLIN